MKNMFKRSVCVAMVMAVCGCAWLSKNENALSADALALVNCVTSGALAGQTVEVLVVNCGVQTVENVVQILDSAHQTVVASPALAQVRAAQAKRLGK
jgi:hypothetical protein